MKQVKITSCNDPQMWYAGSIGETFEVTHEEEDIYWSRELGGKRNIIKKTDSTPTA